MSNNNNDNPNLKKRKDEISYPFSIQKKENKVRVGIVCDKLLTPNFFMLGRYSGSPINFTSDLLDKLRSDFVSLGIQTSWGELFDFLEYLNGFKERDYFKATTLDKRDLIYINCRTAMEDHSTSTISDNVLSASTRGGIRKITIKDWLFFFSNWNIDLIQQLTVDSSHKSSLKRQTRSVTISTDWLRQILKDPKVKPQKVLGVIQGGVNENARRKAVDEILKFQDLGGYVISGFGYGEEQKVRDTIIQNILERLPEDSLKILEQINSPSQILDHIENGIDLFSTTLCDFSTENFIALTFSFLLPSNEIPFSRNLIESTYVEDKSPILKDCLCFSCKNHTRSYIHHLINTKEMLANILLQIHNYYHLLSFMNVVRKHILDSTFKDFKKQFQKFYPN